eukprot:m.86955 g.86955  ORF g.86955 m.86955 type:complete len:150 (-) comp12824_c0_seq1:663-1112(-)
MKRVFLSEVDVTCCKLRLHLHIVSTVSHSNSTNFVSCTGVCLAPEVCDTSMPLELITSVLSMKASVSSDTLYTCVAIGFLAHVVCHSYSPYPSLQAGIVGTNFALASTVALASRLSSSTDSLLFLLASNAITSIHQRFVTQQARHHPPK